MSIATAVSEFVVTECPEHGVTVASDYPSARVYVIAATSCHGFSFSDHLNHHLHHVAEGTDCWACCDAVRIDPHGHFDH